MHRPVTPETILRKMRRSSSTRRPVGFQFVLAADDDLLRLALFEPEEPWLISSGGDAAD
jgi:hypothetical protein